MALVLSDYVSNRNFPAYPVIEDNWFVPNIWGDGDINGRYDDWLYKPQYRIVQIDSLTINPYFVFDETVDREFVGNYSTQEEAHREGKLACGCKN